MTPFRCLICTIATATSVAIAAPPELDPTWGSGGVARLPGFSNALSGALLPDGSLVAIVQGGQTRGVKLTAAGAIDAAFEPILPPSGGAIAAVASMPDGRLVVRHSEFFLSGTVCNNYVGRYLPGGSPDASFNGGALARAGTCNSGVHYYSYPRWLTATIAGDAYFPAIAAGGRGITSSVFRVGPSGAPVEEVAQFSTFLPGVSVGPFGKVITLPDGKILVLIDNSNLGYLEPTVVRLVGATLDPAFGAGGVATVNTVGMPATGDDMAVAPDGRLLIAGRGVVAQRRVAFLARLTAEGLLDSTFGSAGFVVIDVAPLNQSVGLPRLALLPDGGAVLAFDVGFAADARIRLVRLTANGLPDMSFGPGGVHEVSVESGEELRFLLARPDGRILVGSALWVREPGLLSPYPVAAVMQFKVSDGMGGTRPAVEYFHEGYGHYFLTADGDEIALLDTTPTSGWLRTGRLIRVWDGTGPSVVPMCRFWSDQTWAPKSSHFYTAYADECAKVKSDPAWRFERDAFAVRLPEGAMGARSCPVDTQPLYRAYNNGLSGAPNHRFTTDYHVLDAMIAQGWTMEGEVTTRVFACVPTQ